METVKTDNKKEIIARARKLNLVSHVSEAFKRYPVEEEDHKGQPEYWTQEKSADEC